MALPKESKKFEPPLFIGNMIIFFSGLQILDCFQKVNIFELNNNKVCAHDP